MHKIDESEYNDIVNKGNPIVIMASAPWCAPCRILHPLMEKISQMKIFNGVDFYEINTDECYDLCSNLGLSGIPTLIFINKCNVVDRLVGVNPENKILKHIEELLI
jgi:thioredoxin 1